MQVEQSEYDAAHGIYTIRQYEHGSPWASSNGVTADEIEKEIAMQLSLRKLDGINLRLVSGKNFLSSKTNSPARRNPRAPYAIWMRLGDAGEYDNFGIDLAAVAETLQMAGVEKIERSRRKFGVSTPGFTGDNYISLYWGDEEANGIKELSTKEISKINEYLRHPGKYPFMGGRNDARRNPECRDNPRSTPWGAAQHVTPYAKGFASVSTSGHGGFMLSKGFAHKHLSDAALGMAERYGDYYCYEEDEAWAIPAWELPQYWPQIFQYAGPEYQTYNARRDTILKTLSSYYPNYLLARGIQPAEEQYAQYKRHQLESEMRKSKDPDLVIAARSTDTPGIVQVWTADDKIHFVTEESYNAWTTPNLLSKLEEVPAPEAGARRNPTVKIGSKSYYSDVHPDEYVVWYCADGKSSAVFRPDGTLMSQHNMAYQDLQNLMRIHAKKFGKRRRSRASARRSNPELMLMMNPGQRRNRYDPKFELGLKGVKSMRVPSLAEIKRDPEFQKALKKYREFHGADPAEIMVVDLPYEAPKFQVVLGDSPEATYKVPAHSRKAGKKNIPFKHDYENRVVKTTDPSGKGVFDVFLNPKTKVTNWIHE